MPATALIELICANLGIDVDFLLKAPEFRQTIGSDELDRLEKLLEDEDSVG